MNKRARIADVAALAGVSTATVSRTLSAPEKVGESTRKKVLDAVKETGYRINGAARDLRQKRARSILILAPNLANTFFSRIFAAIQDEAAAAGLTVQISDSRIGRDKLATLGHDGRADGIMLLDASLDPALVNGWRLPVAQLCEWNDLYQAPGIVIDNPAAVHLAVAHLAGLKHTHLGHVEGPPDNVLAISRREAFHAASAERSIRTSILKGDFTMRSGADAARRWAELEDRPSGVFCASDECALGFISECIRLGFDVPSDVSVVGFDDIEFADRFIPALTTIRQPREAIGREGAELLIGMLRNDNPQQGSLRKIDADLVVRASSGPAPTARPDFV
ncbi:LacI family DNA-binding transcriptional regulator [Notoacmeibacter ruber]|uniref:LacI family DNA-binding transcriptional regulator n=1 Tax=Notoacmeibacter ruber TaxID=2670375 RepID=A0A3L7J7X7_9HYPH|nr:LacI family DNA-binding transcriptional regulator [Notoacmeibacter ruber]RLQ86848.1 LacI family DNA-binding transcriptional regulator [Notoacmeibacter ruber]